MCPGPLACHQRLFKRIGRAEAEGKYKTKLLVLGPKMHIRTARNTMAQISLDEKADKIFMVDDDMMFGSDLLDVLVDANKDIVGSLCFNSKNQPCEFVDDGAGNPVSNPDPQSSGLHRRMAVGTGAILISTEVFRELPYPWFYYDKGGLTMDVNFCMDAARKGFEVWCSSDALCRQTIQGSFSAPLPWEEENGTRELATMENLNAWK